MLRQRSNSDSRTIVQLVFEHGVLSMSQCGLLLPFHVRQARVLAQVDTKLRAWMHDVTLWVSWLQNDAKLFSDSVRRLCTLFWSQKPWKRVTDDDDNNNDNDNNDDSVVDGLTFAAVLCESSFQLMRLCNLCWMGGTVSGFLRLVLNRQTFAELHHSRKMSDAVLVVERSPVNTFRSFADLFDATQRNVLTTVVAYRDDDTCQRLARDSFLPIRRSFGNVGNFRKFVECKYADYTGVNDDNDDVDVLRAAEVEFVNLLDRVRIVEWDDLVSLLSTTSTEVAHHHRIAFLDCVKCLQRMAMRGNNEKSKVLCHSSSVSEPIGDKKIVRVARQLFWVAFPERNELMVLHGRCMEINLAASFYLMVDLLVETGFRPPKRRVVVQADVCINVDTTGSKRRRTQQQLSLSSSLKDETFKWHAAVFDPGAAEWLELIASNDRVESIGENFIFMFIDGATKKRS
jgi:hypothetical protein